MRAMFGGKRDTLTPGFKIGAPIQMIDLPGIIEGAKDGRGRGRQVIAVAKTCHLIFIVLDVNKPLTDKSVIETELEGFASASTRKHRTSHSRRKTRGGSTSRAQSPCRTLTRTKFAP